LEFSLRKRVQSPNRDLGLGKKKKKKRGSSIQGKEEGKISNVAKKKETRRRIAGKKKSSRCGLGEGGMKKGELPPPPREGKRP